MKVFASHNPEEEIRRQSSSGGVFTMLAQEILKQGGTVYGAAFTDNMTVAHQRVDSEDGLAALRGSKYVYSNVGSAYTDVLADLEAGRQVLFSGTPCQIAAMRKRAGENPRLLLVEIVCHGAPHPDYWRRYLEELCSRQGRTLADIISINFRDKRTGWKNYSFTVRFKDGKTFTQRHGENLYMRAFLQNLTLRDACFHCSFKYPGGSQADITLGDLWGISGFAPQIDNDLGTTLVIMQSESVINCKSDAELSLEEVTKYNPAVAECATIPGNRDSFLKAANNGALISAMKRFASVPLKQKLYLRLARLKNRLIHG